MDDIYLVMLRRYDSVYGYPIDDPIKVFAKAEDAKSFMDKMNNIVQDKADSISDAVRHCGECRGNYKDCADCKWHLLQDDYDIDVMLANGDITGVDCDPEHGEEPEFYVIKTKVN